LEAIWPVPKSSISVNTYGSPFPTFINVQKSLSVRAKHCMFLEIIDNTVAGHGGLNIAAMVGGNAG
jgi:hypothetical protein